MRRALYILLSTCMLGSLAPSQAAAHSSPSGWKYPSDCCTPDGEECDPIPADAVTEIMYNNSPHYKVVLGPKDHKNVSRENTVLYIPKYKAKPSGDGLHHACIGPEDPKNNINPGPYLYCIIIPLFG